MSVRAFILSLLLAAFGGLAFAQVTTDTEQSESAPASDDDSKQLPAPEDTTAEEDAELAAEDAAVDQVLSDAELIYGNEDTDFIPSQAVSADQSLDYPVDI